MKVSVVFEPDLDLGPDPLDEHKEPRAIGLFIDSAKTDIILIYRQIGDQYEGGHRDHIFGSGIWENAALEQFSDAIARLGELE